MLSNSENVLQLDDVTEDDDVSVMVLRPKKSIVHWEDIDAPSLHWTKLSKCPFALFRSLIFLRNQPALLLLSVKPTDLDFVVSSLCTQFARRLQSSVRRPVAVVMASFYSGSIVDWMPPGVRGVCDIGVPYE